MKKTLASAIGILLCLALLVSSTAYAESPAATAGEGGTSEYVEWLKDGWKLLQKTAENATSYLKENLPAWEKTIEDYYKQFSKTPEVQDAWETLKEGASEAGRVSKEAATEAYNRVCEWIQENGGTASEELADTIDRLGRAAGVDENTLAEWHRNITGFLKPSKTLGVLKDESFGNICLAPSIEEFNAFGFDFGDSVNLAFDNGISIEDVPYYSGYYTPAGELLLCGYPGNAHVNIARNYGDSTWEEFGMTDSSKVTVTMNEKGKYLETQELYSLVYSDNREDFDSDIVFANFREVRGGKLKEFWFYRSASPCDNQHNRAACANRLTEENGIRFVLNMSDTEEKYISYTEAADFDSAYYDSLYRDGNVLLLAMKVNYRSDEFTKTISEAFLTMAEHSGPCLIHCVEGKDRTGFACALLLALADATAQEITDDYMITYDNYFGITKESKPETYEAIKGDIEDFLLWMCEAEPGTPVDTLDLKSGAENYLRRGGLTEEQIAAIEKFITVS